MQKPIIIMPEEHWDAFAKQALLAALPMLNRLGYDTLCMEQPCDSTQQEIIDAIKLAEMDGAATLTHLEKLFKSKGGIFNSLLDYDYETLERYLYANSIANKSIGEMAQLNEVIYSIIELPGIRMTLKLLEKIIALHGQLRGVDVVKEKYQMMSNHSELAVVRKQRIYQLNKERESVHVENLLQLQREGFGIVFVVGRGHLENELLNLRQLGCLNEIIVVYPYSLIDKLGHKTRKNTPREIVFKDEKLKDEIHFLEKALVDQSDLPDFVMMLERLVTSVVEKFYKPISSHPAANMLRAVFDIEFFAQQRPSFFVDCFHPVSANENLAECLSTLSNAGIYARITTVKNQQYLCVPEVNEKQVIMKLTDLHALHQKSKQARLSF